MWELPRDQVVPFVGGDIIGHIINIVAMLGAQGLVGLIAIGVIWAIFYWLWMDHEAPN